MAIHHLSKEQYLPITIKEAWDFFSSPANLAKITPPELGFVVLTKFNGEPIYTGMEIDYIVKPLFSIPLRWKTGITWVMEPNTFIDTQLKGPYKIWEHTHTFTSVPGGVKMNDEVKYELPLGFLGEIAHVLIVKKKLEEIFSFRFETMIKLFGEYKIR